MPLALKGKEDMVDQAVVTLLDLTKVCSKNLFTLPWIVSLYLSAY
jgi:hypothetical protein